MHDTDDLNQNQTPIRQRVRNLSLAVLAAQVGCVTVIIVFSALFLGLWIDSRLGQRGLCTVGLLILSAPFSLYVMLRIALGAIQRIQVVNQETSEEEILE